MGVFVGVFQLREVFFFSKINKIDSKFGRRRFFFHSPSSTNADKGDACAVGSAVLLLSLPHVFLELHRILAPSEVVGFFQAVASSILPLDSEKQHLSWSIIL